MKAFHENRHYHTSLPFHAGTIRNINFLAHWHNDLELIYVIEGSIRVGINSESRVLHAGDIAICSSGDIHYYDSKDHESNIILIIFHPQLIGSPGGWPQSIRWISPYMDRHEREKSGVNSGVYRRMTELMHGLVAEDKQNKEHYGMFVTGMLYELGGLLMRHWPSEPADLKKDKRRMVSMRIMQEVLEYLEMNYMHQITLEDAARQARMSVFYFSKFFRQVSGMNYISYLNHIRVAKAETLITSTDRTMLDIALECGFTNVRTFNRVFKQIRHRTPTDFR